MLQIIVAYNSATNIITLTSLSSVVGTIADVGNAQLQVTGIPSGYTAQIDYGIKVYNNAGIPINPSDTLVIADTTGTVMISDGVLQATKEDGILPIQLVLDDTDVGIHIASYNQLRLDVKKAIDATGKVLALYRSSIQKAFIDAQISDTVIIFYPLDGDIPVTIDLSGMFQKPLSAGDNVTIELGTSTDVISANVPVKSVNARTGDITLVKADVGLGNTDNTSDLDKPVSTLQQTALNLKVDKVTGKALSTNDYTTEDKNKLSGIEVGAEVNVNADWNATEGDPKILNKPTLGTAASKDTGIIAGNVPVLNDGGKLADEVMPAISISEYAGAVDLRTDLTGLTAQKGDWAQVTSESGDNLAYNGAYLLNGDSTILANWIQITSVGGSSGTVYSVNGRVGIVVLSPTDVNLGNCNNTSDADKPISNATQTALNLKLNISSAITVATSMPTPSASNLGHTYLYRGATDVYVQNSYYVCILTDTVYSWQQFYPYMIWGQIGGEITDQADLQNALAAKAKNIIAGANIIITRGETEDTISAQINDLPAEIEQAFYMSSSTEFSATKPVSDVSASVSLVSSTATETPFTYTAPLDSTFDTTTKMHFSLRLSGLAIGTSYTWRPVIKATVNGTTTIVAEISSGISFVASATVYNSIVAVPYALSSAFNAPAGTVFTVAVRMAKIGDSSTTTVYIETDIANGSYIYFQRSGGFISTDHVYEIVDSTAKTQHTINSDNRIKLDGIDAGAQKNAVSVMPTADATYLGKVYQYIGATDIYVQNSFYKCILTDTVYSWTVCDPIKLQLSDSNPVTNGTASPGTGTAVSREDHVHPTDTTRQAVITGAATTIVSSNLTASRAVVSGTTGKVEASAVTATELGYLSGVASPIQTQFGNKVTVQTINTDSVNAIVSLTPVANNIYKYTVSGGLTSLTINTVPVSDYEIIIYFTSSTSFTFTDSSGCTWIDADPTFAVSKSYVVSFLNGIGVWGEAQ